VRLTRSVALEPPHFTQGWSLIRGSGLPATRGATTALCRRRPSASI